MKQIDILAIGDIVVDAFIRLNDAEVRCDESGENCKLSLRYGDKIPYESVEVCNAVGNSANAAVSGARLGLSIALFSYVGNDQSGKNCIAELEGNNVSIEYVKTEEGKKTNHHYILWYKADRTILVKHEVFTYSLGEINPPRWLYLSSLGATSLDFQLEIADFIEKHPETKLIFQPGTFQIKMGTEDLKRIYKNAEIFFCNVEEAQIILKEFSRDLPMLLKGIANLGPKLVFITDGKKGSYAYDGKDIWFMPIYPGEAVERTGAGDAFSSTIVSALAMGKTLAEALALAPINSMSVTQYVGAQKGLLSLKELEELLAKAPADYKLKKI